MPTRNSVLKCCFTGHRPQFFPWGNDLTDPRAQRLLSLLKKEIYSAIDEGFSDFLCGGALGVDTWAAQIVLSLRKEYPSIRLIWVLPYKEYNSFITDPDYCSVREQVDQIVIIGTAGGKKGFESRDHYMIDHSERLIAVYDPRSGIKSGTFRALKYAEEKKADIKLICWMDCL